MSAKCCGRCEHFTHVEAPLIGKGEGRCTIYGPMNPEPLVRWDHAPTVLFWPIKDRTAREKREKWIQQMQRLESADDTGNAAPVASAGPPSDAVTCPATSPHPHH